MFGNQDDQSSQQNTNNIPDESISSVLSDSSSQSPVPPATPSLPAGNPDWQHPGLPIDNNPAPSGNAPTTAPPLPATTPVNSSPSTDDLANIKQKALGELSPLINQLDQSPEDKFRTTLMMIQASDNQSLLKDAYAAAHAIPDEKVRAQALLDIVNEINYFTAQHQQN